MSNEPQASLEPRRGWWTYLNKYHWYVFFISALGWLFDTMDGMIFTASRSDTMRDLLPYATEAEQAKAGGYVTAMFIGGWATGGLIFGIVGDRWGRAKTMALTIFIYAIFTGLSGLATTWEVFGFFRFLTGLGVGGEFAAGAALLSEVMPEKARAGSLGMLQALSAVGNILGAVMYWKITPAYGWQMLYYVGAFPALLAVFVRYKLKEPEKWVAAKAAAQEAAAKGDAEGAKFGRMSELFTIPKWRRNVLCGLALAVAGVIGLWGVGFWTAELIDSNHPQISEGLKPKVAALLNDYSPEKQIAFVAALDPDAGKPLEKTADGKEIPRKEAGDKKDARALFSRAMTVAEREAATKDGRDLLSAELTPEQRKKAAALLEKSMTAPDKTALKGKGLVLQQVGAFFGMFFFGIFAARIGRRPTFLISFILAYASIVITFGTFTDQQQVWYLWPLLGFGTLSPFGGYALYFPELFPTRLRTTGTGFCYNVGRYFAILGPLSLGHLAVHFDGMFALSGFRVAAIVVASAYLIGIIALIWAPETKDQPLPEDERGFSH